jgi:hypothetical protein
MDCDFFFIDFIDERLELVKISDSFITRSSELVNSNFLKSKKYKILKRGDVQLKMWEESCDLFAAKVLQSIPTKRIIIIKAYWASAYKDINGKTKKFSKLDHNRAMYHNQYLDHYYNYLEKKLTGCNVVSADNLLADVSHKWGISPFHYVNEWYHDIYDQLKEIFYRVNHSIPIE